TAEPLGRGRPERAPTRVAPSSVGPSPVTRARSEPGGHERVHRALERVVGGPARVDAHPLRGLEHLLELSLDLVEIRLVLERFSAAASLDAMDGQLDRRVQVDYEVGFDDQGPLDALQLSPQ